MTGGAFRSLRIYNYRVWAAGTAVSNIGSWMQRTAQDWIVLTQLTHHNAASVGVVTALQFGPQLLMLPFSGYAADHLDRRKLLIATQAAMGLFSLCLGILVLTGLVRLWEVYVFAFLGGSASAFDAPARQAFVSDMVGEEDLSNAVGLNSTSFNAARLIGPAIGGVMIAAVGSGLVFLINAASFAAVIASLNLLRLHELRGGRHGGGERPARTRGNLLEGFRYVWRRPDLKAVLVMIALVGALALNYPIFISAMSVSVFHAGAHQFGLLTSMMAIGSVTGAFMAARRHRPRISLLLGGATALGCAFVVAALMPSFWLFGLALIVVGLASQTFTTTVNSIVQLSTEPAMRGRVIAILMAIALGGAPVGAPFVGWVADRFGPRWALGVGAAAAFGAALVGLYYLVRFRHLRMRLVDGRPRFIFDAATGAIIPPAPSA